MRTERTVRNGRLVQLSLTAALCSAYRALWQIVAPLCECLPLKTLSNGVTFAFRSIVSGIVSGKCTCRCACVLVHECLHVCLYVCLYVCYAYVYACICACEFVQMLIE